MTFKTACSRATLLALMGCTIFGCLGPRRGDYQTSQAVSIADPTEEADRMWEAIQETLRRQRFRLDRVDRTAGMITTFPVVSQHAFEFWRRDVNTAPDLWESTLNPMRRWVEVQVTRNDDQSWREIAVVVHKERLSSPDRQFNSTGAAFQFFGDSLPSTTGQPRVALEDERWLDRGRDQAMEDFLLKRILDRTSLASVGAADASAEAPAESDQGDAASPP